MERDEHRPSADPLERLFALSVDMLGTASSDGYFTRLNPAWERTLGWTAEELMSEPLIDFIHPDDVAVALGQAATLLGRRGVDVVAIEARVRTRGGEYRCLRATTVAESGVFYFVAKDVTAATAQDDSIRRSEALHRALTANLPDTSVFLIDHELRILIADGEAIRRLPWLDDDMFRGRKVTDLYAEVPADVLELSLVTYRAALAGERRGFEFESAGLRFAVQAVPVRGIDGAVESALVVARDITERTRAVQQLNQAQRLESVGRLAAGVAHDFNNLLTVISGYGNMARQRIGSGPGASELDEIAAAAERAASLTHQLLAFARHQVLEPEPADLGAIVAGVVPMLERLIGDDIEVVVDAEPALPAVLADRGQLEQVVVNLAVNARDAMPGGGTLAIVTRAVELDDDYAAAHAGVTPGPYVELAVTDTGTGIDATTLEHIFEPFFISEDAGSGLGLATVHGIVSQLGGRVHVESEPGQGTGFRLHFPVVPHDAAAPEAHAPDVVAEPRIAGGETILVCEDEEAIRRLIERILANDGYRVISAATPREAIALAGAEDAIDALVSDVVLPGMSGPELAAVLLERESRLRTLFLSGYTAETIRSHGDMPADYAFLEKPFDATTLRHTLRALLTRADQGAAR